MDEKLQFPESKNLDLNLYKDDRAFLIAKALASRVRIEILKSLCQKSMNVKELAQKLDLPVSSAALDVRILEEADLIRSET
ncbi:MAG: helix-turn-helix domain-containing protein, partial [Eubacteriales bacterium]|nr:helix-turn-helix domain-containing protein [Eubacteriales bacterium]